MSRHLAPWAAPLAAVVLGVFGSACWDISGAADAWCQKNATTPERIVGAQCERDEDCCGSGFTCEAGACALPSSPSDAGADAGTDAGTDGGEALTLSEFCAQFGATFASRMVSCGQAGSESALAIGGFVRQGFCKSAEASVARGFRSFDVAAAKACLAEMASVGGGCDLAFSGPSCVEVLVPRVESGGACIDDRDCLQLSDACAGGDCSGRTCIKRGTVEGVACAAGGCVQGLYCDQTSVCRVPLAVGEPCLNMVGECLDGYCDGACKALPKAGSSCAPHFTQQRCASGTYCDPLSELCFPLMQEGSSCDSSIACADGLFCAGGLCGPRFGLGDGCSSDEQCLAALTCRSGMCAARSAVGEACPEMTGCAADLVCDAVLLTCQAYIFELPEGATCTMHTLFCGAGKVCVGLDETNSKAGTCQTPVLNGACGGSQDCPDGAACVDDRCESAIVGSSCTSSRNCQPEHYCALDSSSGDGTCAARLASGDACVPGRGECATGLACIVAASGASNGSCGLPLGSGEPCQTQVPEVQCQTLLMCSNGTCELQGFAGKPCLQGVSCIEGQCQDGICTEPLPDLSACKGSGQLECSGQCIDGMCLTCT